MKEKGIVDNLMHFLVHNSNLVAVVVLCAVHGDRRCDAAGVVQYTQCCRIPVLYLFV